MPEHRKHMRLPLVFPVNLLLADGRQYQGKTKNISFGGILLDLPTIPSLKISDICDIVIVLAEGTKPVAISLEAEVRHLGDRDIGLRFFRTQNIDLDSYRHFKKVMVFNSPDPDQLQEELHNNPSLFSDL